MRGTGSGERGAPRRPPEKGDVTGTWSGCCGTRPVSSRSAACRRRLLCSGHRASKPASSDGRPSAVTCPSPSARRPPPPRALVRAHGTTPTTRDRSPPRRPGLGRTCEVPLTREAAHSLVRGSDTHIFGAVIIQSYPAQCVSCQRAQEQVRYGRIVCTAGARPWPTPRPQPLEPADPVSASIGSGCPWPLGRVFFS